jgi:subtilisin family serine protease
MLKLIMQVDYIEEDSVISIDSLVTEPTSRWNLARISHRARGATNYIYDDSAGSGTCVYIVGTGIETTHPVILPPILTSMPFAC